MISEARKSKPLPIVVMFSEHDSPQYRTLFEQAGASAYFHKGTESAQLLEFLRAAACSAIPTQNTAMKTNSLRTKKLTLRI